MCGVNAREKKSGRRENGRREKCTHNDSGLATRKKSACNSGSCGQCTTLCTITQNEKEKNTRNKTNKQKQWEQQHHQQTNERTNERTFTHAA